MAKVPIADIDRDFADVIKFLVEYQERTGQSWDVGSLADGRICLDIEGADDAVIASLKFG